MFDRNSIIVICLAIGLVGLFLCAKMLNDMYRHQEAMKELDLGIQEKQLVKKAKW